MKIYRCGVCGNIVTKSVDGGGPLSCCGSPMNLLEAGVTDAALEKHVPALQINGNELHVQVGEVLHPMTPEHYIQMILVCQEDKVQYVPLSADKAPKVVFCIDPGKPLSVYEYCNLHGLWKAEYYPQDEVVCSAEFPQSCI